MTTTSVLDATGLFVRRFLTDYVRNPVNLLLLGLVPAVFVFAASGALAEVGNLLGGPSGPGTQVISAGWAAGVIAAVGMYFQVRGAHAADRRVVLAGLPAARLVTARLATGLALAALATTTALLALAVRTDVPSPARVIAGTAMFALIYLAVGALVGVAVRSPVNGTVLILFVWIADVFFGPLFGGLDRPATRALPTHFVTLWMVDLPSRHAGRPGDLGWAVAWTIGALTLSWAVIAATSRLGRAAHRAGRPAGPGRQLTGLLAAGLRERARTPVLAVLLVVVPAVFILGAVAVTPDADLTLRLTDGGRELTEHLSMRDTHGGTMAPIAIGALAALTGLFAVLDARAADRRLILAGARVPVLLTARLGMVGLSAGLVTAVSLAATALVFEPRQWPVYAAANLLVAAVYALVGVVLGPLVGRVAGVFVAFLVPFLDLGLVQSPMLGDTPAWGRLLPGWGAYQILNDGAFTTGFDQLTGLAATGAWLAGLAVAALLLFRPARAHR
ncbi:ABC transporter permease [Actinoplanes sp. NPDC049802]|uniref:ABC transporter permease n=1 Tax=Actinoplanes sp. NPDC049802 TaxID=3154742 RepID=UPI0033FE45D2